MWVKKRGGHQPVGILVQTSWQVGIPSGNNFSKHLFSSKTNCSKPQKQKSSVFPPFWTLSNTFQTPVKRCPQKLNTKTKSPGKQRTSSFSERFFWHFNFRSLFRFYLIPPKTSRIFATFSPFQFNSTLFHPFQPFYVSLVNSQPVQVSQVQRCPQHIVSAPQLSCRWRFEKHSAVRSAARAIQLVSAVLFSPHSGVSSMCADWSPFPCTTLLRSYRCFGIPVSALPTPCDEARFFTSLIVGIFSAPFGVNPFGTILSLF